MNQRGISTIATMVAAAAAGLLAAALLTQWMVVDVHTTGEDAVNLKIPIPVSMIRVASAFVPQASLPDLDLPPEVMAHRDVALRVLRELAATPDTTLVTVESDDANVTVAKKGQTLLIDVVAPDATVHTAVPLDGVIDALEHWDWKTADPKLALRILGAARHGSLVRVEAPDARVAINMW